MSTFYMFSWLLGHHRQIWRALSYNYEHILLESMDLQIRTTK